MTRTNDAIQHPGERLLAEADAMVRRGRLAEAVQLIRQAAELYDADGRADDAGRCFTLAATAARLAGAPAGAVRDATQSVRVATDQTASARAFAELAEALLAVGKPFDAVAKYGAALDLLAGSGERQPALRAALLRKRGLACALAGRPQAAVADLEAAAAGFSDAGLGRAYRAVLVETATLATERLHPLGALPLRERARAEATNAVDYEALVDLDLLDATVAITAKDLDTALACTERARQRALDGVVPVRYVFAAAALAKLRDLRGEREAAYETLSTAWATLKDLMGRDTAREIVQPRLQALVDHWGVEQFAAVKQAYERRRRAELVDRPPSQP
jgi:tetratricopeptide (TPR) repeat protein